MCAVSLAHIGAMTDEAHSEELRRLLTRCPWTTAKAAKRNKREAVCIPLTPVNSRLHFTAAAISSCVVSWALS